MLKVVKIAATYNNFPSSVDLTVTDNEQAMIREILSRHQGEMGGVGQVTWSAYLRTLYLLNHGHTPDYKRPGQYALWAEEQGIYVEDDFPITNLQRFFSVDNLRFLGFDIDDGGELILNLPESTVRQMTTKVVGDFGSGKSVNEVFTPDQARDYINEVRAFAGLSAVVNSTTTSESQPATNAPPAASTPSAAPAQANGSASSSFPTPPPPPPSTSPSPPRAPSPATSSADRKKVFGPRSPRIAIPVTGYPKEQTIVAELRQLDISKTPVAATMLMRALIELSDLHYRSKNSLGDNKPLAKNISKSIQHMKTNGKLNESEADIALRLCNSSGAMIEIETLQKMVHRTTHNLDGKFVNTLWDNIGCFVRACWT